MVILAILLHYALIERKSEYYATRNGNFEFDMQEGWRI